MRRSFNDIKKISSLEEEEKDLWTDFYNNKYNYAFSTKMDTIVTDAFKITKETFEVWKRICEKYKMSQLCKL